MRLLLDTHLLVWWLGERRMSRRAAELIRDPDNQVFASSVSVWEIAVKSTLGKIQVAADALIEGIAKGGFDELPITFRHASRLSSLPMHHRDPFDRMLIAQSLCETMPLLTADRTLSAYGPTVMVVG